MLPAHPASEYNCRVKNEPTRIRLLSDLSTHQIEDIHRLYRLAGWWKGDSEPIEQIRGIVAGSHFFAAVFEGEEIVGMARVISDRASDAYIQDVTVHPDFRGRSLGTQLVEFLVAELHKVGVHWIALIAERGTTPLYEKLGFKPMPRSTPLLLEDPS
ncbi:MAG: GNAT family N-acetyltransferase [Myxococcota bacterium]|nr:GNAT family N-acetyltransferase [Myxococcota bacterium]